MFKYKKGILPLLLIVSFFQSKAQYIDSTSVASANSFVHTFNWQDQQKTYKPFPYKSFIAPAVMIAYGLISLKSDPLVDLNKNIKEEVWTEGPQKKMHADNYLQFAPAVAVYGLNLAGIKGKNNLRDASMIYLMSNVFLNAAVFSVKKISHEQRPDGSSYQSFPSGHTAEAFASAEFLRQEYKDVSPWYGLAGYAAATATGLLRIYNNKHWLSDVVAGAGVGIASTKLAYWLYPSIKRKLFPNKEMNTFIMPYYQDKGGGVSIIYNFRNK